MQTLNLTRKAIQKILHTKQRAFYITILPGGCFGHTYSLSYQPSKNQTYQNIMKKQNIIFYLNQSAEKILGKIPLTLDFEETLLEEKFTLTLAGAKQCSCNKSFGNQENNTSNCIK